MSGWISIESAPRDGQPVLLYIAVVGFTGGATTVGRYDDDKHAKRPRPHWSTERGWLFGRRWDRDNQPTHWMPLPLPPGSKPEGV